jgi:hypothetical protein
VDGSGNFQISFSESPQVDLPVTTILEDAAFGNFVIIGIDNKLTRVEGPANLFWQTNAAGQSILGAPPDAVVPDPLAVDNLTVGVLATIANLNVSGSMNFSGVSSGVLVSFLGMDGSGNVLKQSLGALTPQIAQFFESPTSPNASYPNSAQAAGANLIIGNRLFDSGSNIITVTDSVTLTVVEAGDYEIKWGAECVKNNGGIGTWNAGILLNINGITVSNGGVNYNRDLGDGNAVTVSCSYMRSLAAGDTIRLQNAPNANANQQIFELWLNAVRYTTA